MKRNGSMNFIKIPVRTWYLKFEGAIPKIDKRVRLQHWENPPINQYLKMYKLVGEKWGWSGRLTISKTELQQVLNSSNNEVWLFYVDGIKRGFFEIDRSLANKSELVYLGLLPNEIGKGLGSMFLNSAIAVAGIDKQEIWLHTCEYDHPNALVIYQKAGFKIIRDTVSNEFYPSNFFEI